MSVHEAMPTPRGNDSDDDDAISGETAMANVGRVRGRGHTMMFRPVFFLIHGRGMSEKTVWRVMKFEKAVPVQLFNLML